MADRVSLDNKEMTNVTNGDAYDEASPRALHMTEEPFEYTEEEEKKVLRKIDFRLVPAVWLMYLLSYLDRSNIGNAYTAGMGTELNMTAKDYSVVLLVFFISYVLFEVPSNMLLTRVRPSLYLPGVMFAWGVLSMIFAAGQTWHAIAGLRFLLGVLEAGFAPGVLFLLSSWYKKGELARRYSLYYSAVAISGIFGGLIAGGLLQTLDGSHGISGWRWLFIVEGAATCGVAILSVFLLPDFPSTTRWLTPRERQIVSARLAADSLGDAQAGHEAEITHLKAAQMAFSDWRTWAFTLTYMCTTGSQTIQYFIPELVKSLGYTGFNVQYYTAPIYCVALVSIVGFCFSSDHFRERPFHLAGASAIAVACFAALLGVTDHTGRYVLLCFAVGGVYAACPLVSIYLSNSIPHPSEKRAVAQAAVNALGNSASIWGSYLFPKNSTNENRTGFGVTMALMAITLVMAMVLRVCLAKFPYPELQVATQSTATQGQDRKDEGSETSRV